MNWSEYSERYGETKAEHAEPEPWPDRVLCGYCGKLVSHFVEETTVESDWRCEPPCADAPATEPPEPDYNAPNAREMREMEMRREKEAGR